MQANFARRALLAVSLLMASLAWSCGDSAHLVSITLTPGAAHVLPAGTQQFTATGTYSDGKTKDLGQEVVWGSSNTAVATIDANGLATGVYPGATTITATHGDVVGGVALGVLSIVGLSITPANPTLNPGSMQMLTLQANYDDGSSGDLTATASWTSSAPSTVAVSDTAGSKGVLTASMLTGGQAVITARVGNLAATTTATVSTAVLQSLSIPAGNRKIPAGFDLRLVALGSYDDGSVRNVSNAVTWTSGSPTVATVDATGKVHAVAAGTATLTASYGTIKTSTTVEVTAAMLTGLRLAPSNNPTLAPGKVEDFSAFGDFDDGTVLDVTESVTWDSATPATATIDAHGQVTAVADGTSAITAAYSTTTSPAVTLNVTTGSTAYAERRIPFEFEDIAQTGKLVTSGDDRAAALPLEMGLSFSFFGTAYTTDQLFPCTNGFLRFGGSNTSTSSAFPLSVRPAIAAYFSDLTTAVYAKVVGTAGSRRVIVQWDGGYYDNPGAVVVQAVLYEGTNAIDLRWYATGPQFGNAMSIGVNDAAAVFTQHGYNSAVALSGSAIRFVP